MRGLRWVALAVASVLASGAAAAVPLDARDQEAIQALEQRLAPLPRSKPGTPPAPLAARMAETKVPGVSIAFFDNGRVKWTRAYGEALAGSKRPVTPQTRFQAASMSKAVAAAGALRLVDRGRLGLDEDVALRLRGWRLPPAPSAEKVTLRRLLSHTAGLTVAGYPGYAAGRPVPTIVQSLAGAAPANTAAVRFYAVPGAQTGYSGGGYSVAQLLMSEAAGTGFPRLMQRLVLAPLGMTRSGFDQPLPPRRRNESARGHDEAGKPLPEGANTYPELAAAGLWTTPSDYARFAIALQQSWAGHRGALLTPGSARAMTTAVMNQYGLGLSVYERGGRTIITHGGSNAGFQCRFAAYLDGSGQGLVIMTNSDNGGLLASGILRTLAMAYGWEDPSGPPVPRAPDS